MLLELFPFVILNNAMSFVYAYIQCLDGPVNWFSLTFCVLIQVFYYAPNFKEVWEAYWFGPVRLCVTLAHGQEPLEIGS